MIIRRLKLVDLPAVARIHKEVYGKEHFTSVFSLKHLVLFYKTLWKHNKEYCYGCFDSLGNMLGFAVAGSKTRAASNEFIRMNLGKIIFYLLRHPTHLLEKLKLKMNPNKQARSSKSDFRLLSIATARGCHGRGVAKELVAKLLLVSPKKSVGLSVKKSNANAISAYERIGFVREYLTLDSIYYVIEKIE